MPNISLILAVIGLSGIIGGIYASIATGKIFLESQRPKQWKRLRTVLFIIGVIFGIATWPLTYWMGYPIESNSQTWRIVGIPFFVAAFDSAGRDYVGPLTLPGIVGNILFWSLLPQLILLGWSLRLKALLGKKA